MLRPECLSWKMPASLFVVVCLTIAGNAVRGGEKSEAGWIPLFNGKDLSGWYTYLSNQGKNNDPDRVFTVEDGVIHLYKYVDEGADAPLGFFSTQTEYSHYHLRFQYRWGEKRFDARAQQKRDSGALYHSVGPDGILYETWPRCLECQIQEGDTGDTLCLMGARFTTTINPKQGELPPNAEGRYLAPEHGGVPMTPNLFVAKSDTRDTLDGWNTVEVMVMGSDYAVHIVNGHVVHRLTKLQQHQDDKWVPLAAGRILFQAEQAEVFFRNIEIKPLATGPFRRAGSAWREADGRHVVQAHGAKPIRFTLPDDMEIQRVAGPPLVNRPICADFDEQGRLYVADSSGSNDFTKVQLQTRPHRIVRLEDTDGDGRFDESVVFADRMMFPEGALWYDGSLYVGAPPHIWKLTDTDGDGQADQREIWHDGKTLHHCGNDMHGPYLGPDGWFYWCKGAFEEQTIERPGGDPLVTRAAHIFRRHPSGGLIEHVMTGGMDNPIEVVFTPGGERILTATFVVEPRHGLRDGILHAIYGGVYGREHGYLAGHPRTGPIMPVLAHHGGASAPCGFVRLETNQLGPQYQNNLLACSFNLRKVIRHVLQPDGASFTTEDSDFLTCDSLDFHPTDVLEDADGSLLVVDTGGWYNLCCPSAHLSKPDVLGSIYRIRRTGSPQVHDARGKQIAWTSISNDELVALLADQRFIVRNRARQLLGKRGTSAVANLREVLARSADPQQRLQAVWSLTQIADSEARNSVRAAVQDKDETVRHAALHSISLHRDAAADKLLVNVLKGTSIPNRRAAAEALGRIGPAGAVGAILDATADCTDPVLMHSLIYALIEPGDPEPVASALGDNRSRVRRAAMIALDQIPDGGLKSTDVIPLLESKDPVLAEVAWWIVDRHPTWAGNLAPYFRKQVEKQELDAGEQQKLAERLARVAHNPDIQSLISEALVRPEIHPATRLSLLEAMKNSQLQELPQSWSRPLGELLESTDIQVLDSAVGAIHALAREKPHPSLVQRLQKITVNAQLPDQLRLEAFVGIPAAERNLDTDSLGFLCDSLSVDQPVRTRSLAVDVLVGASLSSGQFLVVADALPRTGPMELRRLMEVFAKSQDAKVGIRLVESLENSPAATSLPIDKLKSQLLSFGEPVESRSPPLFARLVHENKEKIAKLESILELTDQGDIRRGQEVFFSNQAACISCHSIGYTGGRVGPDLTRIGNIRTERDLLESVMFPSASLVQSYEPQQIITTDGHIYTGIVAEETRREVVLKIDAEKTVRIESEDIDQRAPSRVSMMPEGLDKHFSGQQLADLVVYLKTLK